jgi:hemerythrin-like domain-containing protein
MHRDEALVRLSEEHHHGLVFSLRIERELPEADEDQVAALYADLLRFWAQGLLPHFHTESECLLARLVRHVPLDDPSVLRLQRDHLSLEALVAAMRDADTLELRRLALTAFGEALRAHIRWEERDLFELLQGSLDRVELAAAGREILDRHEKPTRPPWEEGGG